MIPPVVINEVAWMGTTESSYQEWIELYNNTDSPIDLRGWVLKAEDETPLIILEGTIPAQGFYLLARGEKTNLLKIKIDQTYKGSLNNKGENLLLYNEKGNLIDFINAEKGWPAGDNETKRTMERIDPQKPGSDPSNWKNSEMVGGTPKSQNSKPTSYHPSLQTAAITSQNKKVIFLDDSSQNSLSFTKVRKFIIVLISAFLLSLSLATSFIIIKKRL